MSIKCPKCGNEFIPEQTVETGEEGGYLDGFQPGDLLTCGKCGTEYTVPRKFYKTVVTIEILSEHPIRSLDTDLGYVTRQIEDGDWSGRVMLGDSEELTPKECAQALIDQDSEPQFFGLDDDGNEVD